MQYDLSILETKKTAEIAARLIQLDGGVMHYTRLVHLLNCLNLESLKHRHRPISDLNPLMEALLTEHVAAGVQEPRLNYQANPAFSIDELGNLVLTTETVKPWVLSRNEWDMIAEVHAQNDTTEFDDHLLSVPELLEILEFDSELKEAITEALYDQAQIDIIFGA